MWAQLITMRLTPGNDMAGLDNPDRAGEQPGSGLVGTLTMHDQTDPSPVYAPVVFDSDDTARAREQGPRRQEKPHAARAMMADIFDDPPQFTDLTVTDEWTGRAGDPWVTPASLSVRSSAHPGTSRAG